MIKQFTSYTQKIGEKGEDVAVTHLQKQGWTIIDRNVPNKYGEIDIVAKQRKEYYFYEVKTAKQGNWFNPADNMTESKVRKFLVSVEHYCLIHRIKHYKVGLIVVWLCETDLSQSKVEILSLQ